MNDTQLCTLLGEDIFPFDLFLKISIAGEERLNRMIDEVRLLEAEKRDNMLLAENEKVAELEGTIESLRLVCTEF